MLFKVLYTFVLDGETKLPHMFVDIDDPNTVQRLLEIGAVVEVSTRPEPEPEPEPIVFYRTPAPSDGALDGACRGFGARRHAPAGAAALALALWHRLLRASARCVRYAARDLEL